MSERDPLLDRLSWRERIEFRSRHEFPPTTIPYEEVTGTAEDLFRALAAHNGGYRTGNDAARLTGRLRLVPPGSGSV